MATKKEQLEIERQVFKKNANHEILLERLKKTKQDFLYRKTNHMISIIADGTEYVYKARKSKETTIHFPSNQLWIFNSVKNDALKFLEANPSFDLPPKLPVNITNYEYDDSYGEITGTDVNSAYWVIAFNMGVISEKLFLKCNKPSHKVVRLASLAVLGRVFTYEKYEGGIKSANIVIESQDARLKTLYRAIRYKCYEMMGELAILLGKDFEAYRTDCIYYRDSFENRTKVYEYLKERNFEFKQLVYDENVDKISE
jgi:hypothetical protein